MISGSRSIGGKSDVISFQQQIASKQADRQAKLTALRERKSVEKNERLKLIEQERLKVLEEEKRKQQEERQEKIKERKRLEDERKKKEEFLNLQKEQKKLSEKFFIKSLLKRSFKSLRLNFLSISININRAEEWRNRRTLSMLLAILMGELRENFKEKKKLLIEIEMEAEMRYLRNLKRYSSIMIDIASTL